MTTPELIATLAGAVAGGFGLGVMAEVTGRRPATWFWLSFFLSPFVGVFMLYKPVTNTWLHRAKILGGLVVVIAITATVYCVTGEALAEGFIDGLAQ